MDSTRRLRIANRIRIVLQRELGVAVDVSRMLRHRAEAAEVLCACKGLASSELLTLAAQFEAETRIEDKARLRTLAASTPVAGAAPSSSRGWAALGSGFGFSKPLSGWDDDTDSLPPAVEAEELHAGNPARMVMQTRF
ncbi:hypothetical protein [Rivibacter subsaxonicus]|uniref:Uncharacterized protein n=1 Tax=Rivibacter subsaxonicus TaxID=457575 RepID=A0A4Q7W0R7_9BURK|nr:hypothetical protein [Rivibacter subsaxonicus]RZU02109.1 hypothetical protein EV670_0128 [Rivibacter subsaxonicus]